ncbi:MAG: hypothetical protein AAFV43_00825 [Planctomycetota bacterium]
MKRYAITILATFLMCSCVNGLRAATIIEAFVPATPNAARFGNFGFGQSITLPPGGPFTELTFNLYEWTGGVGPALAEGQLFVLSEEYLGPIADLSNSTPGFIASTEITQTDGVGAEWVLPVTTTLAGEETYYFLVNALNLPVNTISLAASTTPNYLGGDYYDQGFLTYRLGGLNTDLLFELSGIGIPEPSSAVIAFGVTLVLRSPHSRRRRHVLA